jgi:hypothetical protein
VTAISREKGVQVFTPARVVLAMGCRERPAARWRYRHAVRGRFLGGHGAEVLISRVHARQACLLWAAATSG